MQNSRGLLSAVWNEKWFGVWRWNECPSLKLDALASFLKMFWVLLPVVVSLSQKLLCKHLAKWQTVRRGSWSYRPPPKECHHLKFRRDNSISYQNLSHWPAFSAMACVVFPPCGGVLRSVFWSSIKSAVFPVIVIRAHPMTLWIIYLEFLLSHTKYWTVLWYFNILKYCFFYEP